jgi:uncharacterized protein
MNIRKRAVYILFVLMYVLPFSFTYAYSSPGKAAGYVNDFAGVMSKEKVSELSSFLTAYTASTTNEIAVVTVPSLNGDTVENYSNQLFREWGIGNKKNNGILFLVAVQDHKTRIEVGYGLEGDLTDLQSSKILNGIVKPFFKNNDYDGGIDAGVKTIVTTLSGNGDFLNSIPEDNQDKNNLVGLGVFAFYMLGILMSWLGSVLGRSKSWWLGGVLGAFAGLVIGYIIHSLIGTIMLTIILALAGLLFDYIVSTNYKKIKSTNGVMPWWIGGSGFGGSGRGGGGFGGFGGGSSGGGGASGSW